MEDLNNDLSKVFISAKDKLEELIKESELLIKKENYIQATIILKKAMEIDAQNDKVVNLTKKLISSESKNLDKNLPKELLSKICDEELNVDARLEVGKRIEALSSQANSVFVNQFNEINGSLLLLDTLFTILKDYKLEKEELLQVIFRCLTNLCLNSTTLKCTINKLSTLGNLSLPKLQESTVSLFSNLLQVIFNELDKSKDKQLIDISCTKVYPLYLNVLYAIGKQYSKVTFKKVILPLIQTFPMHDFSLQFSNHVLFKDVLIDYLYDRDENNSGLVIVILSKVKEDSGALDNILKSLKDKFFELQSHTSQLQAFTFLKSIFQSFENLGLELLSQESFLLETIDLISYEKEDAQIILLQILSLACNNADGRKLILETSTKYLNQLSKQDKMDELKAQAILIKSKLLIENKAEIDQTIINDLVTPLIDIIIDKKSNLSPTSKMTAVESLTFYSIHPKVRNLLGTNFLFWNGLVALGLLEHVHPATLYGISAIMNNVLSYRKILTKEQEQIKKLKKLAKESTQTIDESQDPNMSDDMVKKRNSLVIRTPKFLSLLIELCKTNKYNIWSNIANVYLSLSTDKQNHGDLFKFSTVKTLLKMTNSESTEICLLAAQSIAKLGIHTNPNIAFPGELKIEVIRPLLKVCQGGSEIFSTASLLQQFECLLALTNLCGAYPETRQRLFNLNGLPSIEMLMLSDNSMIQRAASELLCNMSICLEVYEFYSKKSSKNRIHTLLALADIDNNSTVLAATGALATFSNSAQVCVNILDLPIAYQVLPSLIASDASLDKQLRGLEIFKNIILAYKKEKDLFKDVDVFKLFNADSINNLLILKNTKAKQMPQLESTLNTIFAALTQVTSQ